MTDTTARLSAALADRYRIEREVGAGGMATVYLAQDLKHDRPVAVKVLRPELAAALGPDRFLREIKVTAQLNHPHILQLYDSGETDGFLYYVMPYVEGESLRDRLEREKQLPVEEALEIAREVADALGAAHARDVVHRDIKPENILLSGGHAVVADFGVARAVDAAGGVQLTDTGLAVGTPVYMSPEQAAGERELDGRSDQYALGCVLFEMLTGQPPFTGTTADVVIRQHLTLPPPPLDGFRAGVPADLTAAVQRALAKNPADRFAHVSEFSGAIRSTPAGLTPVPSTRTTDGARRRIVAAVAGVVAIGIVAVAALSRLGGEPTGVDTPSVAVLPFVDLSPDQADAYLGEGIAETLINALANVPGLDVAARTSAFSFRGQNEDIREIGRELGVSAVLEGSVQRAGGRLRITAQLVKTSDGLHLWSRNFDRGSEDIFALQDDVAAAVATALRGELLGAQTASTGTSDPAAYDAYLQGRFFWNRRTVPDLVQARGYFEDAIARDSSYAQAWAGLADVYMVLPFYSDTVSSGEVIPRARQAANRALTLNPNLAEARATLGYALAMYDWDWEASEREFLRAIESNSDYATAYKWYSDMLAATGRFDEALAAAQRAAELEPRSPNVLTIVALREWVLGREAEARAQIARALDLDPTFVLTLMYHAEISWDAGDTAAFFEARDRLDAVSPYGRVPAGDLRAAYAAGGADSMMRLLVSAPAAPRNPMDRARWHVRLGEIDAAFADIEQATRERNVWLSVIVHEPAFAPLRADPRFETLAARRGMQ